jgi:hypothetical protein
MLDRTARRSRLIVSFASFVALTLISAVGAGCSRGADDEAAQAIPQQAPVDPRYATVEGLLGEFNSMTTREPVDTAGMLALIYAENPKQKDLVEMTRLALALKPLDSAMQAKFKQPAMPEMADAFEEKPNGAATLTSNDGARATATYKDHDGSTETLQLVKYDNRWWVSGYTLEHVAELKTMTADELKFSHISLRTAAAVAPAMTDRINTGEFRNADDARKAFQIALQQQIASNPADQKAMQDLVQRNPKLVNRSRPRG